MTMVKPVGVYISEGTLRDAATESNLQGASKSELLRFALLRTVMSAKEARDTVFGITEDYQETNGRVDAKIPDHELELVVSKYPDVPISDLARYGFALAAGELNERAWTAAKKDRGYRAHKKNRVAS
jgi:hypothetical protein